MRDIEIRFAHATSFCTKRDRERERERIRERKGGSAGRRLGPRGEDPLRGLEIQLAILLSLVSLALSVSGSLWLRLYDPVVEHRQC